MTQETVSAPHILAPLSKLELCCLLQEVHRACYAKLCGGTVVGKQHKTWTRRQLITCITCCMLGNHYKNMQDALWRMPSCHFMMHRVKRSNPALCNIMKYSPCICQRSKSWKMFLLGIWRAIPSWKSPWIFMRVHEIWWKNAPIIHEISWRFINQVAMIPTQILLQTCFCPLGRYHKLVSQRHPFCMVIIRKWQIPYSHATCWFILYHIYDKLMTLSTIKTLSTGKIFWNCILVFPWSSFLWYHSMWVRKVFTFIAHSCNGFFEISPFITTNRYRFFHWLEHS